MNKHEFQTTICGRLNTRYYNRIADGRERLKQVLDAIERLAKSEEDVPSSYATTAYAIGWAYTSLRLNGEVMDRLVSLKVRELAGLIYDLHRVCQTIGEVKDHLNHAFSRLPEPRGEQEAELLQAREEFWTLQAKLQRARKSEMREALARDLEAARKRFNAILEASFKQA